MGRNRPGCRQAGRCIPRVLCWVCPASGRDFGEPDLKGFKYFKMLLPLLERLRSVGTARDKAGNRELFFDQYAVLLLLYFFNPIIKSMRALQRSTKLEKSATHLLGLRPTSLGSLSRKLLKSLPPSTCGPSFRKSLVGLCRCIKAS